MKEKTWFDRWVDFEFEYKRLNDLIATGIRQNLEIIEKLGLENEIDKYLIEGELVDQEWFRRYKLEPYLSQRFPYHNKECKSCKFTTTTKTRLKII